MIGNCSQKDDYKWRKFHLYRLDLDKNLVIGLNLFKSILDLSKHVKSCLKVDYFFGESFISADEI